ncbi:MAG: hypothetical protein H0T91_08640 [Propionibacteriaceae bacterium]|nr:hypothetical protein [Propionibacteriaceae bacterium]
MSEDVFGPSLQPEREKARQDKRVQQDLANWPDRLRTMVALAYEQLQRSTTPPVETLSDGQSVIAWVYAVQGSRGIAITMDGELAVAFMLGLPLPPRLSERRVTELPWAGRGGRGGRGTDCWLEYDHYSGDVTLIHRYDTDGRVDHSYDSISAPLIRWYAELTA